MVSIALIAIGALVAYAILVRLLGRSHPLSVVFCLAVVVFGGGVLFGGLYGLVLLLPGMRLHVHDQHIWAWPSVWHAAGIAFIYFTIGMLLFLALLAARRVKPSNQAMQRTAGRSAF